MNETNSSFKILVKRSVQKHFFSSDFKDKENERTYTYIHHLEDILKL